MESGALAVRWTSIALVVVVVASFMAFPPPPTHGASLPPGGTFVDDDGSVHEGFIEAIAEQGITMGCNPPTNDRFCPDRTLTRSEMAAFIDRARGLPATGEDFFIDDDGSIFEPAINRLAAAGVTRGCNPPANNQFCPGRTITRREMAAFLVRTYGYVADGGGNLFSDDDGSIFESDIDRLAAAGVTRGCNPPGNDRFCPNRSVTRAEMASFMGRAEGLAPITPDPRPLPLPGNPDGNAPVPAAAAAEDVSTPDTVIGNGTPQSCTSAAVVAAVAGGGIITFDCGQDPVTIEMTATAKIVNNTGPVTVIDGGAKVTLSGRGERRILYMNTCDQAQVWTTSHCQNQDHPRLTVQNLSFVDGNAKGEAHEGGGAIFVRGGRFKVVNSTFFNNVCDDTGPDVGGAAVRVLSQHDGLPVHVTHSTFGGAPGYGNVCSNGGGVSSIGVSWTIINSLFSHNLAIGNGANPAQSGTPGGGSGGAIYNDGNTMRLTVRGTLIEDNHANEGGGAIFYVSNNRTGSVVIEDSVLRRNPSDGFETAGFPGMFVLASGPPSVSGSTIE